MKLKSLLKESKVGKESLVTLPTLEDTTKKDIKMKQEELS